MKMLMIGVLAIIWLLLIFIVQQDNTLLAYGMAAITWIVVYEHEKPRSLRPR